MNNPKLYFIWILIIPLFAKAQFKGLPLVQNFNPQHYKGGMQNWWIDQDTLGNIFTANNQGVLRFDGTTWQMIDVFDGKKIRSLDLSDNGVMYVGGENEMGYLKANKYGILEYVSLVGKLPKKKRDFQDIWRIHCIGDNVFFQAFKDIFLYQNDTILVIRDSGNLSYSFNMNDRYVVADYDKGLVAFEAGRWEMIPGGKFFMDKEVSSIVRYNNQWLVGVVNQGLYYLDGTGNTTKWQTEIDMIGEHTTDQLLVLKNGDLAVATRNNGLIILNKSGELVHYFSKGRGLESRAILNVCEDREGDLWLGLNNGIARIELTDPFTYLNEQTGVQGAGYNVLQDQGLLYLCARNGLFTMNNHLKSTVPQAHLIEEVTGQTYAISKVRNDLFLAAHSGAYQVKDNHELTVSEKDGWWMFLPVPNRDDLMVGGTYDGLYLIEGAAGKYKVLGKIEGFEESSRLMLFESENVLWVSHGYKGAYRMQLSSNYTRVLKVEHFGKSRGFPSDIYINVFKINDEILFTAERGVYRYDKVSNRVLPYEPLKKVFGDEYRIYCMDEDVLGNLYFTGQDLTGVLRRSFDGSYSMDHSVFQKIHTSLNDDFPNINVLDEKNILFGAKEGFIHFDPSLGGLESGTPEVYLDKLHFITGSDSLLAGYYLLAQYAGKTFEIPFRNNSLKISYTSPYYSSEVSYSYKLEGLNERWSEWSGQTSKEYTNLKEGEYIFRIKAKNILGHESPEKQLNITIHPPWYRTTLSKSLGFVFFLSLLIGLFRIQSLRHRSEKEKIFISQEKELTFRDNQLQEVSEKSREAIEKLKNEKMKAELAHKSRELATSTMNIIQKNELMTKIKSELKTIKGKIKDQGSGTEISRIIKNIDRNIGNEKDWDQFQVYFDEVHGDFSKRFKETFPDISPQELRLCAFLRLNMNSKDVANLLNISVRSVETNRYRLRKKLNLGHHINLTSFILDF
ncbi:triple tyrosine motif-containing protein [Fulvivirgaceae bacterium BMA12]|uniref:Triple tyrosine motif-containing protein n=1 Tax=Agaribacillus aureus TaxID=3051825 RepID=A0ABT8LJK1_9BACT|nr:triple tyrosine motif-containing protein [Fulvivirgaceae bacterium BMA12]